MSILATIAKVAEVASKTAEVAGKGVETAGKATEAGARVAQDGVMSAARESALPNFEDTGSSLDMMEQLPDFEEKDVMCGDLPDFEEESVVSPAKDVTESACTDETKSSGDVDMGHSEKDVGSASGDALSETSENAAMQKPIDAQESTGRVELTEAQRAQIKEEMGWSDEIVDHIDSMKQYEIYKKADIVEVEVNGRKCLCKKIDMNYIDPKTGLTNRERIKNNLVPIDAKTGERIELHHMGQDPDGPFAELCENSEHGDGNHSTLHPKSEGSWRGDTEKKRAFEHQKREHWAERAQEGME